jgi:hypothetical protein
MWGWCLCLRGRRRGLGSGLVRESDVNGFALVGGRKGEEVEECKSKRV